MTSFSVPARARTGLFAVALALAGLLGAGLITGGLFGAATAIQFDAAHARGAIAVPAAAARAATDGLSADVRIDLAAAAAVRPATDGLGSNLYGDQTAVTGTARTPTDGLTADIR
jgi:hypothetical protein